MSIFNKPSSGASTSVIYITVGALTDVWSGIWFWYLHSHLSDAERHRHFLEIRIGKAGFFLVAVRFDQAGFIRPTVEGLAQRRAQAVVFVEVEH